MKYLLPTFVSVQPYTIKFFKGSIDIHVKRQLCDCHEDITRIFFKIDIFKETLPNKNRTHLKSNKEMRTGYHHVTILMLLMLSLLSASDL